MHLCAWVSLLEGARGDPWCLILTDRLNRNHPLSLDQVLLHIDLPGQVAKCYSILSLLSWRRVIFKGPSGWLVPTIHWHLLMRRHFHLQRLYHPLPQPTSCLPPEFTTETLTIFPAQVSRAVMSFPVGSSGGPDGLRPQHLRISQVSHRFSSPVQFHFFVPFCAAHLLCFSRCQWWGSRSSSPPLFWCSVDCFE